MEKKIEEKAKECFGKDRTLKGIERLLGGAQKHTYLAILDNGFKFVVYVWDKNINYFSGSENITNDLFLSSSALMFKLNNELLIQNGIRTPKLYYIDPILDEPIYAFVEYIDGVDLDYIIENQPERLNSVLKLLKNDIDVLHGLKNRDFGFMERLRIILTN